MFDRHRLIVNVYFDFPSILVCLTVILLIVNVYFDFPSILVCLTVIGLLLMYILIFPPYWCVRTS